MQINNGTPTLSTTPTQLLSNVNSDRNRDTSLTPEDTVIPTKKIDELNNQHRQSSAYSLTINTQDQQTALTYNAKSQYSLSSSTTNTSATTVTASATISEPPVLLESARNILSFIEQRLSNEHSSGADLETLDTLLQQGLAGFIQGYDEARAILGEQESFSGNCR